MVITDRLLVNVSKRQDYALTIATGTLAFLAVIVIGLMAFRYNLLISLKVHFGNKVELLKFEN